MILMIIKNLFRPRVKTAEIKRLLKSRGLSQRDVAEGLNITPEYLNQIIHGRYDTKLNPPKVPVLAGILDVTPKEISRLFAVPIPNSNVGDDRLERSTSCS